MKILPRLLKLLFFVSLTILIVSNTQKIKQRPEIYINNDIIKKVNELDFKPTKLIQASVIVTNPESRGSGSIIKITKKSTYILTAAHVLYESKVKLLKNKELTMSVKLSRNITVKFRNKNYKALPIKVDRNIDVAVIKIYKSLKTTPVKIAKHEPKLGETVWAISNPDAQTNLVNKGVFSAIDGKWSIVSTGGFFGSSGGMVINTKGEQIGIISNVLTAEISGYFPTLTGYNGITRTKALNKFLKGIL